MTDSTPLHLLSVGEPMTAAEMEQFKEPLLKAWADADLDGQLVIINGDIEAVTKDELLEAIQE